MTSGDSNLFSFLQSRYMSDVSHSGNCGMNRFTSRSSGLLIKTLTSVRSEEEEFEAASLMPSKSKVIPTSCPHRDFSGGALDLPTCGGCLFDFRYEGGLESRSGDRAINGWLRRTSNADSS